MCLFDRQDESKDGRSRLRGMVIREDVLAEGFFEERHEFILGRPDPFLFVPLCTFLGKLDSVLPVGGTHDAFRIGRERLVERGQGGGSDEREGFRIDVHVGELPVEELAVLEVAAADDDIGIRRFQSGKQRREIGYALCVSPLENDIEAELLGMFLGTRHHVPGEFVVLVHQGDPFRARIPLVDHVEGSPVIVRCGADRLDDVLESLPEDLVACAAVIHVDLLVFFGDRRAGEGQPGSVRCEREVNLVHRDEPFQEARDGFLL